ncbi:RICIN domain-containing protein [Streptomyces sp. NPDC097619]|uniref:RICIN domain-containing protein n=1 Tax=Streptomyces sp. NPDC097619 TaxID=3157228 RepID=UPI003318CB46
MLRRLALPVLSLLFLAAMLPTPTTAVAASGSKYGDARLDQWSWLTTHNSYAHSGAVPPRNQSREIPQQLDEGVRGLMLDTYDMTVSPEGDLDVMLCHSTHKCYGTFANRLGQIVDFLKRNPNEVVTIFLENYAGRASLTGVISGVLEGKNAKDLLFSPSQYDIDDRNWPRVKDMVSDNRRLVILQDKWGEDVPVKSTDGSKEYGRLMHTWSRTVETLYDYDGRPNGCASRTENPVGQNPMPKTALTPLFTMNQFDSSVLDPENKAPGDNGAALKKRIDKDCRPAAGRNPNYVAVNFYEKSDTSGVTPLSVVNELNRNAHVFAPHPALWTVTPNKQYVGQTYETSAPNRCMVRGDEFPEGTGGVVTQRACASPAPSSHQWTATPPSYDGKGFFWIKANNGNCLTVPANDGVPPGNDMPMFWWPCETRWSSGNQLWNIIPVEQYGGRRAYYFINQWTGKCLTLDPKTNSGKVGRVTQDVCPNP